MTKMPSKMGWAVSYNTWILSRASVDIIENSYGKNRIEMSEPMFEELRRAKAENYAKIYRSGGIEGECAEVLSGAFEQMYDTFCDDLRRGNEDSFIFRHHIARISRSLAHYGASYDWQYDLHQTVVDYIASMTDGYFAELATKLLPDVDLPRRTYINER